MCKALIWATWLRGGGQCYSPLSSKTFSQRYILLSIFFLSIYFLGGVFSPLHRFCFRLLLLCRFGCRCGRSLLLLPSSSLLFPPPPPSCFSPLLSCCLFGLCWGHSPSLPFPLKPPSVSPCGLLTSQLIFLLFFFFVSFPRCHVADLMGWGRFSFLSLPPPPPLVGTPPLATPSPAASRLCPSISVVFSWVISLSLH